MKTEHRIFLAFILNLSFSVFEFFGGIMTGSAAIISDSIHDLGDAISIGISYLFEKRSNKLPDKNFTLGYKRYSLLGSLITTLILIIGSSLLIYNSILRIFNPKIINYNGMIVLGIIGLVVNYLAAYFTHHNHSKNLKAVNLHMIEDVFGWAIVLIGAIIMKYTKFIILDAILSIILSIFIIYNAYKILKDILDIFILKTPKNINLQSIYEEINLITNVNNVRDIKIFSVDENINYAIVEMSFDSNIDDIYEEIKLVFKKYNIENVSIKI